MADAFPELNFTKNWTNPTDFPTVEESEEKVRADLQLLHNETQRYINSDLKSYLARGAENLGAVPAGRKVNGMELSEDISLTASDVGAVPDSRTVNGKPLTGNVTLSAADISGVVPDTRTVNGKRLNQNITLAAADISGVVPTSRTVNSKALSANITLTAADVGAVPTSRKINGQALTQDITISTGINNVVTGNYKGNGGDTKTINVGGTATLRAILIAERFGDAMALVLVRGQQNAMILRSNGTTIYFAGLTWGTNSVTLSGGGDAAMNADGHYYDWAALVG